MLSLMTSENGSTSICEAATAATRFDLGWKRTLLLWKTSCNCGGTEGAAIIASNSQISNPHRERILKGNIDILSWKKSLICFTLELHLDQYWQMQLEGKNQQKQQTSNTTFGVDSPFNDIDRVRHSMLRTTH